MRNLSIVLPCYNEESAVGPVLQRLHGLLADWRQAGLHLHLHEVIIVNDGSTDGTVDAVNEWIEGWRAIRGRNVHLQSQSQNQADVAVSIISHDSRRGYGAALKTGVAATTGNYIAFYDVDGTYDPALLPVMVSVLERRRVQMVCGDRLSLCEHMPLTREIGNRLFVGTINLLYQARVYDSCTGMRVFSRDMRDFFASDALPDGLDYSLAMTLSFLKSGRQLIEVPIPYARRIGRSKLRVLTDGPRFFWRILSSWAWGRVPSSKEAIVLKED
ncbi:MAG: glycosyltransferase family 2 protein [Bdellovibrionales bacterium]|nr:glycosyltransferase family 2 protein [Bdellovibrionales bacterium]